MVSLPLSLFLFPILAFVSTQSVFFGVISFYMLLVLLDQLRVYFTRRPVNQRDVIELSYMESPQDSPLVSRTGGNRQYGSFPSDHYLYTPQGDDNTNRTS